MTEPEPQDLTLDADLMIQTRIDAFDRAAADDVRRSPEPTETTLDQILTNAQKIEAFFLTGEVAVD